MKAMIESLKRARLWRKNKNEDPLQPQIEIVKASGKPKRKPRKHNKKKRGY